MCLVQNIKELCFRRHHIGFVFQSYNLISTLTVAENLLLPLELIKPIDKTDREKVHDLLSQLDLANRLDTYPDRLSGGEQQRIAIGRALIHNPDIILADEPTGNLDLETGEQVLEILDKLVREAGKTLIMATHSQQVIGQADRVFTINNKALGIDGRHKMKPILKKASRKFFIPTPLATGFSHTRHYFRGCCRCLY